MNTRAAMVQFHEVSFAYGKQIILNKIQLTMMKGTTYALIGKSGVGKSTLLNLIAGFIQPNHGHIEILGEEVIGPRQNTVFLFQELGLFPWQTVYQAVLMPIELKSKRNKKDAKDTVMNLLIDMRLEHLKNKYPHELSGGERQRVALARALIGRPDIILMDEPTSSLDSMTKEMIQELILKQQQKLRSTLLFVTHDIEEAVLLGEKICVLQDNGTIQELDNPYSAQSNAKEQLGFYDQCIQLRKLIKLEC